MEDEVLGFHPGQGRAGEPSGTETTSTTWMSGWLTLGTYHQVLVTDHESRITYKS